MTALDRKQKCGDAARATATPQSEGTGPSVVEMIVE